MTLIVLPRTASNKDRMNKEIYFIGIGGAGAHILDRLLGIGFSMGKALAIESDSQVLSTLKNCKDTLMISEKFSTGGDMELGFSLFEKNKEKILSLLPEPKALFVIAGLGGGTGSAGILSILNWANQLGIPVISLVILPFSVEGETKTNRAKSTLLEVKAKSYISIVFDNNDIIKLHGNIPMQKALLASDIRQMKNLLFEIALLKGYNEETAIGSLNLSKGDYNAWKEGRSRHDSTFNLQIDNKNLNWFTPYEIEMVIKDFAKQHPQATPAEIVNLIHRDTRYEKLFIYPSEVTKVLSNNKHFSSYKDIYLDMFNSLRSATQDISDRLSTKLIDWFEVKVNMEGKQKAAGVALLIDLESNSIIMRLATKIQINKPSILPDLLPYIQPNDKVLVPDYKYFNNLHSGKDERIKVMDISRLGFMVQLKKQLKGIIQQNEYLNKDELANFLISYVHNYNNVTKYDEILRY